MCALYLPVLFLAVLRNSWQCLVCCSIVLACICVRVCWYYSCLFLFFSLLCYYIRQYTYELVYRLKNKILLCAKIVGCCSSACCGCSSVESPGRISPTVWRSAVRQFAFTAIYPKISVKMCLILVVFCNYLSILSFAPFC